MLKINMDVSLHRMPCAVVSVNVQDVMGSNFIDVQGIVIVSYTPYVGRRRSNCVRRTVYCSVFGWWSLASRRSPTEHASVHESTIDTAGKLHKTRLDRDGK